LDVLARQKKQDMSEMFKLYSKAVAGQVTPDGQFLGRPSELSSVLEEAKFFLIASTIKEGTAIPRPTHPYNKGTTLIQARTIKAKPTQKPTDVILSNFNLIFSLSERCETPIGGTAYQATTDPYDKPASYFRFVAFALVCKNFLFNY
jgi:hypothetical protein